MTGIAAVVLAAGQGSRFRAAGGAEPTKVVARLGGLPLVRHVVRAALASATEPTVVVTGHARMSVEAAVADLPVRLAHNPDFATGLASSLRTGIAAVPASCGGAVVLLADMPSVSAALIDDLLAEARSSCLWDAIVPVVGGRRGNPVVLSRTLFAAMQRLSGDAGARYLLQQPGIRVRDVPIQTAAAMVDIDEPGDLDQVVLRDPT